jgi:hypothetical protein
VRLALALALVLAACQPWYRDDQLAGRRARDPRAVAALLQRASEANAAGDPARAAAIVRDALERNPLADLGVYLTYAQYLHAAGEPERARAALRFRIGAADGEPVDVLWSAIVDSYLASDLTADALDIGGYDGLASATAAHPALAAIFQELLLADSATDPAAATRHLRRFLDAYGAPDHPFVSATVMAVREKLATGRPDLVAVLDRADAAVAAGDHATARLLYAEAYRMLPPGMLASHAEGFVAAAAAATDPASADPLAHAAAVEGDEALRAGRVGAAIHAYRRAVALAPWWRAAHENLRLLYEAAGRVAEADGERAFLSIYWP